MNIAPATAAAAPVTPSLHNLHNLRVENLTAADLTKIATNRRLWTNEGSDTISAVIAASFGRIRVYGNGDVYALSDSDRLIRGEDVWAAIHAA